METVSIQEIRSDQDTIYKAFFLTGLLQNEDNFRMTPGDIAGSGFPTNDRDDSFTLGAYVDGELAGVVSFMRDGADREKLRHKGTLFRMYVAAPFSGKGAGRQLIQELLQRVNKLEDVEQINLTVIATNPRAKALYESLGFKTFSIEVNAVKWEGQYLTEEQMVLRLKVEG